MSFRAFFFEMSPDARRDYAARCASTMGYLTLVAYERKRVELGLADCLVAMSGQRVALADLPLTDRAVAQHAIRTSGVGILPEGK